MESSVLLSLSASCSQLVYFTLLILFSFLFLDSPCVHDYASLCSPFLE